MQSLVALLTLSAILGHAVLGCCWHHAHAGQAECVTLAEHSATDESHARCGHSDADCDDTDGHDTGGEGHKENHRHECGEDACKSLIPSKLKLPTSDQVAWTDLLPPVRSLPAVLRVRSFWSHVDHVSFWGDLTPLRLRALTQVWVL